MTAPGSSVPRLRFVGPLLLGLLAGHQSGAQPGLAVEAYGQVGSLRTRTSDRTLLQRPVWGAELTLSRQTTGRAAWQRAHGLPQMGLTLRGRSLGNASVYGYDLALVPFLEFNVWQTKRTILQIKHGTGIGYATKRHETVENPNNQLISTAFNAVSLINIGLLVRGNDYVDLKVGVEISHESNGNLRQPNEGLNTGTFYAGMRYYPGRKLTAVTRLPIERHRHEWRGYVGTAIGLYGAEDKGQLRTVPQLEALVLFQHDIRFRAIGGLEVGFLNGPDGYQLGLKLGEEVLFGHVGIRYQVGTYLHDPANSGPVFEKIGMAWYPLPLVNDVAHKFSIGTSLKAHGLRAAFIEINAGYVF